MRTIALSALLVAGCGALPQWPELSAAERAHIDACSLKRDLKDCLWDSYTTRKWITDCNHGLSCWHLAADRHLWDRTTRQAQAEKAP